jgi:hypothetical protein
LVQGAEVGALAAVFGVGLLIIAMVLALRAPPRSKVHQDSNPGAGKCAEQWGVQMTIPAAALVCPRGRELAGHQFTMDERPPLPLPECPYPHQCECRFTKLFERRKHDRRSGHERRHAGQRFETSNPPRRDGNERRKKGRPNWTGS